MKLEQLKELPYQSLEEIFEALPEDTKLHSIRVAEYIRAMHEVAGEIELDLYGEGDEGRTHEQYRDYAYLAGKYHEIGLILLPEHLRISDEKMTPEEVIEHNRHVEYGGLLIEYFQKKAEPEMEAQIQKILDGAIPGMEQISEEERTHLAEVYRTDYEKYWQKIREGILYHHEEPDGSGYPEGLTAQSIPLAAWLVSEADNLDKATAYTHMEKAFEYGYRQLEEWYEERDLDEEDTDQALSEMHLVLQLGKSKYEEIFRRHQDETLTLDCRPPLIPKKDDRFMQFRYRKVLDPATEKCVAFDATPFFFYEEEKEAIRYEEIYEELENLDIILPVWSYFLYEASDMLERMAIYNREEIVLRCPVLKGVFQKKGMLKVVKQWMEESEVHPEKILFTIEEQMLAAQEARENIKVLQQAGFCIGVADYTGQTIAEKDLRELQIEKLSEASEETYLTDDEILEKR